MPAEMIDLTRLGNQQEQGVTRSGGQNEFQGSQSRTPMNHRLGHGVCADSQHSYNVI
jgi:hypothetical protein